MTRNVVILILAVLTAVGCGEKGTEETKTEKKAEEKQAKKTLEPEPVKVPRIEPAPVAPAPVAADPKVEPATVASVTPDPNRDQCQPQVGVGYCRRLSPHHRPLPMQ